MNPEEHITDSDLLKRSINGDKNAYGQLVKRYMKQAYFLALSFVHSHDDAIDISQDAFIRVWRKIRKIDPARGFFPYYYTTLRNLCLNALRNTKKRAQPFSYFTTEGQIEGEDVYDTAVMMEQTELQTLMERALRELRLEDSEIIMLKDIHGYSYKEIAGFLSIPIGTVMSRLHAARVRLRDLLRGYGYE